MASMQQCQAALSTSGLHVQDISADSRDAFLVVVGPTAIQAAAGCGEQEEGAPA